MSWEKRRLRRYWKAVHLFSAANSPQALSEMTVEQKTLDKIGLNGTT